MSDAVVKRFADRAWCEAAARLRRPTIAQGFRQRVENAGYTGMVEVEIFSRDNWWKRSPDEVLQTCAARLQSVC